jgi:hypothetical protein
LPVVGKTAAELSTRAEYFRKMIELQCRSPAMRDLGLYPCSVPSCWICTKGLKFPVPDDRNRSVEKRAAPTAPKLPFDVRSTVAADGGGVALAVSALRTEDATCARVIVNGKSEVIL